MNDYEKLKGIAEVRSGESGSETEMIDDELLHS